MKKILLVMAMVGTAMVANAKDIKTVVLTTSPVMHCESCENKIKGNLKFEKGVKKIDTDIAAQKVTVEYDADKTSEDKIIAAFTKFGYTASKKEAAAVCGKTSEGCCAQKKSCCGAKETRQECAEMQTECKVARATCGSAEGQCQMAKEGCKAGKENCKAEKKDCKNEKKSCCQNKQ